jgi:hypothetical protein
MVTAAQGATIAQRLDRLPLTWTLWRLALVTQAGWGMVVATDAIAARIYPFVWGPEHDGFGHVGSILSPLIVGALFTATASAGYIGFFAYVIIPGALLPGLLLARFGIDQRAAPLEMVTGA